MNPFEQNRINVERAILEDFLKDTKKLLDKVQHTSVLPDKRKRSVINQLENVKYILFTQYKGE